MNFLIYNEWIAIYNIISDIYLRIIKQRTIKLPKDTVRIFQQDIYIGYLKLGII